MLRVLERGQFRSLAHCLCNRSTGRGIEILVSNSPVEMPPASDGGAGEKCGVLDSRMRPNGTTTMLAGLLWQYHILRLKLGSTSVLFTNSC